MHGKKGTWTSCINRKCHVIVGVMCSNVASIAGRRIYENKVVSKVTGHLWSLKDYNVCNFEHGS